MADGFPQPGQNVFSAAEEKAMRLKSVERRTAAPAVDYSQTAYGRAQQVERRRQAADPSSGAED